MSLHFSCGVTGSVESINPEVKKNLVEFKNSLEAKPSVFAKSHENVTWLKSSIGLLKMQENIYITGEYDSPKNQSYKTRTECDII